jgi:hypothetical protein
MRFFDEEHVGCYLDAIGHRVEKTKDGETKLVDLTLRVQPFTPQLAIALDPDIRALIFTMGSGDPKPKIKKCEFALVVPQQRLVVRPIPDLDTGALSLFAVQVTKPRVRTEKDVDGFAFICRVTVAALGSRELEFVQAWYTEQRFVTFEPEQPALDFAGAGAGHASR